MGDKMAQPDNLSKKLKNLYIYFIYIRQEMQIKNLENSVLIYFLCKRFLKITSHVLTHFQESSNLKQKGLQYNEQKFSDCGVACEG